MTEPVIYVVTRPASEGTELGGRSICLKSAYIRGPCQGTTLSLTAGFTRQNEKNATLTANLPAGFGGVSLIVCSTFMSRMLCIYRDSSRHTMSR